MHNGFDQRLSLLSFFPFQGRDGNSPIIVDVDLGTGLLGNALIFLPPGPITMPMSSGSILKLSRRGA
jgi:hypothetical protein